ncbi:helix-turn-helix transcriptional regulator [Brucella tritici]|uniref:XRE family transcriptional regulator n=1 Tax=Brucella tritici TaxID=94626 RepID=A0A6L3YWZ7_9HYPH|nr:XRE family transcriptional regulator [Brucella tritici]KAB2689713.1 XRE family transcriptional regulator [Brucella tritici]
MRKGDHAQRYAPRGMSRAAAALYIGVGTTKFDEMVKDGRMPQPKRVDARVLWDREELDISFDNLPSEDTQPSKNVWDDF